MAQDPRELQWQVLYGELATALGTFGRESAYGDGDFWLVDDDWGSRQHKVCVTRLAFVTSELRDAVQHVLARFPDWEVLIQVDEKVGDIAASAGGFRVKADGITSSFG